jgi:hypothetical protein
MSVEHRACLRTSGYLEPIRRPHRSTTLRVVARFLDGLLWIPIVFLAHAGAIAADRPGALSLWPDTTIACVRVADAAKFLESFRNSSTGRILQDSQIRPLVDVLYKSAVEAFREKGKEVGLSLGEIAAIAQGEFSAALVPSEQGRPAFIALIEVRDQLPAALRLFEHVAAQMEKQEAVRSTTTWQGIQLTVLDELDRSTVFFHRDGAIVVASDLNLAKDVLSVWSGTKASVLADHSHFRTIQDRCAGAPDDPPQLTYFVKPLGLVKSATASSDSLVVKLGIGTLEMMGLDGLLGLGGSLAIGGGLYDSVHHAHLLLETPSNGVLEVVAFRPGDLTPEVWVPGDLAGYTTLHWDFPKSYAALVSAYNVFAGAGGWAASVERPIADRFGVSLERDILAALDGRVTQVMWMQKPARPDSATTLLGIKLKDPQTARPLLKRILDRLEGGCAEKTIAGVVCYEVLLGRRPPNAQNASSGEPKSYFAILDGYVLSTGSEKLLEHAIQTQGGAVPPLNDGLDYKIIASEIGRQPGGRQPSMIVFQRPYETLRNTYDLLRSDDTRKQLAALATQNRLIKAVHEALDQHPLPPFDALTKYLAPTGGLVASDASGIHYVRFTLKREP